MTTIPTTVLDKASWADAKELDAFGEDLTQFEIDFLESILQQMLAGRTLTDKQREKLASIREDRL